MADLFTDLFTALQILLVIACACAALVIGIAVAAHHREQGGDRTYGPDDEHARSEPDMRR